MSWINFATIQFLRRNDYSVPFLNCVRVSIYNSVCICRARARVLGTFSQCSDVLILMWSGKWPFVVRAIHSNKWKSACLLSPLLPARARSVLPASRRVASRRVSSVFSVFSSCVLMHCVCRGEKLSNECEWEWANDRLSVRWPTELRNRNCRLASRAEMGLFCRSSMLIQHSSLHYILTARDVFSCCFYLNFLNSRPLNQSKQISYSLKSVAMSSSLIVKCFFLFVPAFC